MAAVGGAPGGAHRDRRGPGGRALAPGRGAPGPRAALGRRDHLRCRAVAGHVPGGPTPGDRPLLVGPRVRDRHAGLRRLAARRGQGPRASRRWSPRSSGAGAAVLIARAPRLWWLAMAGVVAAFIYLSSLLSPVLIEPLFQRTEPLRDPALSAQILDLAHRAGVDADGREGQRRQRAHHGRQRLRVGPGRQPPHRPVRHPPARLPARPGADGGGARAGARRAPSRAEGQHLGRRARPARPAAGVRRGGLAHRLRQGRPRAPRAATWCCAAWPWPPPRRP